MNSLKKIVIIGPVGDFGGRELECGFIASVLSSKYVVDVCSTGIISKKSQVFDFNKGMNVFTVKELLFDKYLIIKLFSILSFFKNRCVGKASNYVNNVYAKKFLRYDKKVQKVLEELITGYDAVFIIAQLSSGLMTDVIRISKKRNKKVLFRTTGAICFSDYDFIKSVDCFIHHSANNTSKIESNEKWVIIDQCAYNEKVLLSIPLVRNKAKRFLTIARLDKEKNIDVVIKAFKKVKTGGDILYVIGDGKELDNLKQIASDEEDIIFTGFLKNKDLPKYFSLIDCVIISHYDYETGPLTGIEAMCASRLIISAKTGAMLERLSFNPYWFNNSIDELSKQILMIKDLTSEDVFILSQRIRDRYIKEYSAKKIGNQYLKVVKELLDS